VCYDCPVESVETLEFLPPDFQSELDVEFYLARVPQNARCKGMFFRDVLAAIRYGAPLDRNLDDDLGPHAHARYLPFKDYPLRSHMDLTSRAVKLLYPDRTLRQGMRQLGWLAYSAFVQSMVGRIVLGVLGSDLEQIFAAAPKSIELSMTRGRATAERVGERHFRYDFRDIYGYLDSYYVGVVEGPIRHHGFRPDVRLALTSPSDGIMDIRWT